MAGSLLPVTISSYIMHFPYGCDFRRGVGFRRGPRQRQAGAEPPVIPAAMRAVRGCRFHRVHRAEPAEVCRATA